MSENFDHGYALLIGVGAHSYPSWSLPVTVKDVNALRHVLTHRKHCAYPKDERHMRLLCDERATRANILAALDDLAAAVAKDPVSTAVVYYSGHGCLQKDQKYFLVPHDTNPRKLAATALRAEDFTRKLRNIRAQRLLVILDTCYAEGMAEAKDIPRGFIPKAFPEPLIEALGRGDGRAVLSSCRGEESSWVLPDRTMSIFTKHLIEALKGASNSPGETLVTVADLMKYVSREVQNSAERLLGRQQKPFFKIEAGDFPVALIPEGKKHSGGERRTTKRASADEPRLTPVSMKARRDILIQKRARDVRGGDSFHIHRK